MQRRPRSNSTLAAPCRSVAGFTIVELLVVIGVIAILVSLVSVAVTQAGQTARQTQALSNLKQVGTAWLQYANQNDDRCMLGYADEGVQTAFRMRVKDAAGNAVLPANAATYPFRLLPFLNNDRSMMYEYIDEYEDSSIIPEDVIAQNPGFGYNAFYLGGWWETVSGAPKMRFGQTAGIVARSVAQIAKTTELIVFSASTSAQPGYYKSPNENAPGSAWVVPHILADTPIWQASDGGNFIQMQTADRGSLNLETVTASLFGGAPRRSGTQDGVTLVQGGSGMDVLQEQSVPLRRIKNVVQTIRADLSTTTQGLRDLMDQRRWINTATSADPENFTHSPL